jgi:hypothetical protein
VQGTGGGWSARPRSVAIVTAPRYTVVRHFVRHATRYYICFFGDFYLITSGCILLAFWQILHSFGLSAFPRPVTLFVLSLRVMIGRSSSLHRPRRSVRKYVWALAIVFVFCLWQSSTVTRRKASDPDAISNVLPSKTAADTIEAIIKGESPIAGHIGSRHVHPKPAPIVAANVAHFPPAHQADTRAPTNPNHNAVSAAGGDAALTAEDDMEGQDLDDIERIEEHRDDDGVEHAARLTHPDDDDAATSNEDAQDRIEGTKDKGANVYDVSQEQRVLKGDVIGDATTEGKPQNSNGMHAAVEPLKEQTPWSQHYEFPSWDECQELKEKAEGLPDLLHVPFEVSVKDVVLEGWEDDWIAKARYSGPRLEEPKIDFVYTCEY